MYLGLALGTISLGLVVHWYGQALPPTARDVLGDSLWAAMVYWWIAAGVPQMSYRSRGLMALAFCFAVEVSQLYHAPALDAVRQTAVGQLGLGSGFDPRDLAAYAGGVIAATCLDVAVLRWRA